MLESKFSPPFEKRINLTSLSNLTNYKGYGDVFGEYVFNNQYSYGRPVYERGTKKNKRFLMVARNKRSNGEEVPFYDDDNSVSWVVTDSNDDTGTHYIKSTLKVTR